MEPKIRNVYRLRHARNLSVGVWDGMRWIGIREKCGELFLDASEMTSFVTFDPEPLAEVPDEIACRTSLGTYDAVTGRDCEYDRFARWWKDSETKTPLPKTADPWDKGNQPLFDFLRRFE